MALLELMREWGGAEIAIVSVNHGLRDEAIDELKLVSQFATRHKLKHDILQWQWDGTGNLQNAARTARRDLIAKWAIENNLSHIALGHTKDDQAETFLLRLARGSGVDGLACMEAVREERQLIWLRPLLDVSRDALRQYLLVRDLRWADDPSNEDERFDRVKARNLFETLAPLGLTVDRLAQTAAHMRRQKHVVEWIVEGGDAPVVATGAGDLLLQRSKLEQYPEAIRTRFVSQSLCAVSGNAYPPRYRALKEAIASDAPVSLHGCLVLPERDAIRIAREWASVKDVSDPLDMLWDGRWRITFSGHAPPDRLRVKALGQKGLAKVPGWRDTGYPRQTLWASPAIWDGETLIAAPVAGLSEGWIAELVPRD